MTSSHSQTRASIDLGAGLTNSPVNTKTVRNHPPRLQHSPSLPNIWFPPHSDPISRIESSSRELLERSTSPTPTQAHQSSITPSLNSKKVAEHRETLSFDDLNNHINKRPHKLQMRRRIDHDNGHSLLTPPLTPSSSLRTSTSISSSDNAGTAQHATTEAKGKEQEISPAATHFLLLGNISKTTPSDTLRSSIIGSLTTLHIDPGSEGSDALSVPSIDFKTGSLNEDTIKGVFVRCQKSHGIVMLAFFDIRHAVVAKTILTTPSPNSPLAACIGDDTTEEGERRAWISCRFVTADELAETIGNSTFLASVDGSFYISAEVNSASKHTERGELRIVDDRDINETSLIPQHSVDYKNDGQPGNARQEINITMLKGMLNSFGVLRSFSSIESESDKEDHTKTFHLEYYDVREANAAYIALDGQLLFGMKLKVFGRETSLDQSQNLSENKQRCPPQNLNEHSKNIIPFPSTTVTTFDTDNEGLEIAPPGHYSQTRERFLYPPPSHYRPRSVSAGQHLPTSSVPPAPSIIPSLRHPTPSPTYFYTSPSAENQNMTQYRKMSQVQRIANQFLADHTGRSYAPPSASQTNISPNPMHGFNRESLETGLNTLTHPDSGFQPYSSHHDCYYCPSRNAPSASDRCYTPYSTHSPLYYPHSTPAPTGCYPTTPSPVPPPIPVRNPGYDCENANPQLACPPPNVVMATWPFENGMMTTPHPSIGDFWYAESNGVVRQGHHNIPYYPQPTSPPTGYSGPHYSHLIKPEPQIVAEHHVQMSPPTVFCPNIPSVPSPAPIRPTHATQRLPANNSREPQATPERNQLNLAKIEDGQDTRTTVMVKNIPNKMSDKDLIAYIGKVCPRKIDFLYLRMDFKNGCNVGYAFVNFIKVQDLLFFAKKKLGEKWNMFSSEKVLQMSYANYQGKEALVEKFKNSCIMDEREAWRPKIFYSDPGPEQGLPEPFPAPTHLRRKERSSFNRGALYVPGTPRGCPTPQVSTSTSLRCQNEEQRSQHGRHVDRGHQIDTTVAAPTLPSGVPSRRRSTFKTWGTSCV